MATGEAGKDHRQNGGSSKMKNGIFQFAATTALTIALSASPAFAQK